jgi:ferric-dicitrate binding protein FerR (iron transport regulator)
VEVSRSDGDAVIRRGFFGKIRAGTGFPVRPNDVLVTGTGSIDVSRKHAWAFRVHPGSKVRVLSVSGEEGISLEEGRVVFQTDERGRNLRFRVETPVVIASVRGTLFLVRALPGKAGASVAVLEGTVYAAPASGGRPLAIAPGEAVDFTKAGPGPARPLRPDEEPLLIEGRGLCTQAHPRPPDAV